MKKFRWFTLLETVLVIVIIGIVSVSLLSFRRNIQENKDLTREALTVFYKEMNSSIKDFQRNKIWEDASWVTHEMTYLYLNFNNNDNHEVRIWNDLVIWNIYLYTWKNWKTRGHFDWTPLILESEYSAFQSLKWSDKYKFYTCNEWNTEIKSILIANNWTIFDGYLDRIITSTWIRIDENGELIPIDSRELIREQIKPNTENPLQRLTFNFEIQRDDRLKENFSNIREINDHTFKFLVCWWYWNSNPQPIWIISINAITQATNLERCENEKYAWVNCDEFARCW